MSALKDRVAGAALRFAHFLGLPGKAAPAKPPKAAMPKATTRPTQRPTSVAHVPSKPRPSSSAVTAPTLESKAAKARRLERDRCRAIIMHGVSTGRIAQAQSLAFDSNLMQLQAINLIDAATSDGRQRTPLADRMADVRAPNPGFDGGASASDTSTPEGTARMIVAAGQRARGTSASGAAPKKDTFK